MGLPAGRPHRQHEGRKPAPRVLRWCHGLSFPRELPFVAYLLAVNGQRRSLSFLPSPSHPRLEPPAQSPSADRQHQSCKGKQTAFRRRLRNRSQLGGRLRASRGRPLTCLPEPATGHERAPESQRNRGGPANCARVACKRDAITFASASRMTTPVLQSSWMNCFSPSPSISRTDTSSIHTAEAV